MNNTELLPDFDDADVQIAYRILCQIDENTPPGDEHWEGFTARRIIAALRGKKADVEAQSSPSAPPLTRSEVTVLTKRLDQVLKVMRGARNRSEPMAVWADDIKAVEDARALLDQFEIRRKM